MSDYNQIKNLGITIPDSGAELGSNSNRFGNLYLTGNISLDNTTILSSNSLVPKITSLTYVGNDTAADPAGGQTITINGSGFMSGLFVYVGGVIVASATYVSSTTATFVAPAKTAGIYTLVIANPDGGTATYITGMQYSGTPTWSTTAGSLANVYEYGSVSATVTATGDTPITYTVSAGNSLPSGLTIGSSNGVISGTTTSVASGSTTTNFYLNASDAQNQDTARNFSITVNADSVTWSSPADNSSYSFPTGSAISTITLSATSAAGKSITYTANSLPTGLSLSGSTITGTPTVTANTTSLITATAATTGKTATRTLSFVVAPAMVAATGGSVATSGNYKIHTFTSTDNFVVTNGGTVEYLAVGGGGGGGGPSSAGYGAGGAGGLLTSNAFSVTAQTYTITIGAGGGISANGSPSIFSTTTAIGGGRGGEGGDEAGADGPGGNGGSGGGAGRNGTGFGRGVYPGSPYIDAPRQGYDGGNGTNSGYAGGGGGGAGSAGGESPGSPKGRGDGGDGVYNSISGSSVGYAGGGGAPGASGATAFGGGNPGSAGSANKGGGGGGNATGGSGIVIIKYQYQ